MIGTVINVLTVLVGGILGTFLGSRLPDRVKNTVIAGLGLFTLAYGVRSFMKTENPLVIIGAVLIGALLGEWWRIEDGLQNVGQWLEKRLFKGNSAATESRFVKGFFTASLVFCVGPMSILGSIQDGLTGDYNTLAIKAVLDGFGALAFASSLGIGVVFSVVVILIYQGGISLLASQVQMLVTTSMMNEMTAAGGVLLAGIAISSLLEMRKIRTGNFLPALIIAPILTALMVWLGAY